MRPTLEYIQQRFDEFNRECFHSSLPPIRIQMCNAKTFLGKVCFKKTRNRLGLWSYTDYSMHISTRFDFPEREVEDTILHEMIHYYIHYNKLMDTSAHGAVFRSLMEEINTKYQRNISISHHITPTEYESDSYHHPHFLCITEWEDGKVCLTAVAKTRLFQMWDFFSSYPKIKKQTWYRSFDPYFNRYRNALRPKVCEIKNRELLYEHLQEADVLERYGEKIFIKKRV